MAIVDNGSSNFKVPPGDCNVQLRLKATALNQCCKNFNQYKNHSIHNPTGSAELQWFLIEKEVELGPKPKFPLLARVLAT